MRSKVLDVGCATGGLMQAMIAASFKNVYGISLSQGEVDICQRKGLKAAVCDITQRKGKNDLITLSHVLEHVPDVKPFLDALHANLAEDGYLYIEVPDASKYLNYCTSIAQGFNREHINHFDMSHLLFACLQAKLDVHSFGWYRTEGTANYDVIWAMLRSSGSLKTAINDYASSLFTKMNIIREQLSVLPSQVAVWGCGETTHLLMASMYLPGDKIRYATDTNPVFHGKKLGGCTIVAPEQFNPPPDIPIVVCSQLSQDAIIECIKRMNLKNRVVTLGDEE